MTDLYTWARDWNVPLAAVQDLQRRFGAGTPIDDSAPMAGKREAAVSAEIRLRARRDHGGLLLRNNSGALLDATGRQVRYVLGNDSKAVNETFKSPDWIGCYPRHITEADLGSTIGQLWLVEAKAGDWTYGATKHEQAQLQFGKVFMALGARFQFSNGGPLL